MNVGSVNVFDLSSVIAAAAAVGRQRAAEHNAKVEAQKQAIIHNPGGMTSGSEYQLSRPGFHEVDLVIR